MFVSNFYNAPSLKPKQANLRFGNNQANKPLYKILTDLFAERGPKTRRYVDKGLREGQPPTRTVIITRDTSLSKPEFFISVRGGSEMSSYLVKADGSIANPDSTVGQDIAGEVRKLLDWVKASAKEE
ncbi:MAG: hypothetical protein VKJ04_08635 [Vampirovibrionales bacterium]|nr:hypothetical protein [Vampirovibrionales bacterium]